MLSLILVIIAAIANAIGDKIQFHWDSSIFAGRGWDAWANPKISWRRKWRWKGGKLDQIEGEAFLGSSTVFVSFTDLWHAVKSIQLSTLFLAIVLYHPVIESNHTIIELLINFALLRVAYGVTFETLFSKLLNKK
jgi:hypothetical protein